MKKRTTLKSATGLPLTGHLTSPHGEILLIFGDYYVCLGIDWGYEAGDEEIEEIELDFFRFGESDLVESGVISGDELRSAKEERERIWRIRDEKRERIIYERLKSKFEDIPKR